MISVTFSILLPFLKFRVYNPQPVLLAEITVTPYRNLMEAVTIYGRGFSGTVEQSISSSKIIILVYLAGLLFFLGRFVFRLIQILILIRKNQVEKIGLVKFVSIDKYFSPFSFLSYVFINPEKRGEKGYEKMLAHEMEHIKQSHTFDVIILEIMTFFQWFNPFMWILKRVIRENHEFLADQAVLNSGVSPAQYKQLLLNQFVGGQLVIANNFNYSLIKSRIKMISKIKSSKLAITKVVFGILIAAALVIAFACEQKESIEVEQTVEEQSMEMKLTLLDEKIKIEATSEGLEKLKSIFSGGSDFEIVNDSFGNVLLVKKEIVTIKKLDSEDPIFFIVEDMPEFPGGELALRKYIASAIKYPKVAQENGVQGKVYVTFVVSKDGTVANCKIARGVNPSLDKEALRVVNGLPKWKPGKQRGQAVNVSYTVPINFVLQ